MISKSKKLPKNLKTQIFRKEISGISFEEQLKDKVGKIVKIILLPEKPNTLEIQLSGKLIEENLGKIGKVYEVNNKLLNYVSFSTRNIESITHLKRNGLLIHLKL